jgi:hypothetical protein
MQLSRFLRTNSAALRNADLDEKPGAPQLRELPEYRSSYTLSPKAQGQDSQEQYRFWGEDPAVRAAMRTAMRSTRENNREYGGYVTRDMRDGSYGFAIAQGYAFEDNPADARAQMYSVDKALSQFHSHPQLSPVLTEIEPNVGGIYFSYEDVYTAHAGGMDGYMVTPNGSYLHYNNASGEITRHLLYPGGVVDYPMIGGYDAARSIFDRGNSARTDPHSPSFVGRPKWYGEGQVVTPQDLLIKLKPPTR